MGSFLKPPDPAILVVEDEYHLARMVAELLREAGHEIAGPVPTIAEAMQIAGRSPLVGALVDVALRDGCCEPLVQHLRRQGVPIAFMTGYDPSHAPVDLDAAPVLEKPFSTKALLDLVSRNFVRQ